MSDGGGLVMELERLMVAQSINDVVTGVFSAMNVRGSAMR
jgi:hypothetical protein